MLIALTFHVDKIQINVCGKQMPSREMFMAWLKGEGGGRGGQYNGGAVNNGLVAVLARRSQAQLRKIGKGFHAEVHRGGGASFCMGALTP